MLRRLLPLVGIFMLMFAVPALRAQSCALPPRLVVGELARVTPGVPNNIRAVPGQSGQYLGEIPPGEFFTVLEGPTCSSGLNWWRVRYGSIEGWTPEGDANEYWVEPERLISTATATVSATPLPTQTPTVTPTLLPLFATAAALGFDLWAEANVGVPVVSVMFNDVEMVLVRAGCYQRTITPAQALALAETCRQSAEAAYSVCSEDEYVVTVGEEICFDKPFWIDRYEVSHLQYETYLNKEDTPHQFNFVRWSDDHPRGDVAFEDAVRHCFLRGGRIPMDVEWEYAARGPANWIFTWGDFYEASRGVNNENAEQFFNSDGSFLLKPAPVNDQTANDVAWVGALHLSGNVAEWVAVTLPGTWVEYATRGGSANSVPTAMRTHAWPASGQYPQDVYIGFRCVRDFQLEDLAS